VSTSLSISGVELSDREAVVSLSAIDGSGNPVTGLSAASFAVTIDGVAARLAGFDTGVAAGLPLALVIVVDTSGSMQGDPLASAKQAIRPLVQSLRPGDRAALVAFASTVSVAVPFTADVPALLSGLERLAAGGNTALYAASAQAAGLAASAPEPRRAVALLTDGEEFGNVSGMTREQALAGVAASRVPFFAVGLGAQVDRSFLEALAAGTAGQTFLAARAEELAKLYDRISERLRLQYSLRIVLPDALASGDHVIRISVGPAAAETTFRLQRAAPAPTPVAQFAGLDGQLSEPTTMRLEGLPEGARVVITLDGSPVSPLADGRSLLLDPYSFPPGGMHTLVASFDLDGKRQTVQTIFGVAALRPRLLGPKELPQLAIGDLVRLSVLTQEGATTATYIIDGRERERDAGPPYEFVVPGDGLKVGKHEFQVVLSSPAGDVERRFAFAVPGGESHWLAYVVLGLSAVAAVASAAWGAFLLTSRVRRKDGVDDAAYAGRMSNWTPAQPGPDILPSAPSPVGAGNREPWGKLTVTAGPGAGTSFDLRDDPELVGRGKACSVRLRDRKVEQAHLLLYRDGTFQVSSPACRLLLGGQPVTAGQAASAVEFRLGDTALRFERFAG
jgi:VWFA-related protein